MVKTALDVPLQYPFGGFCFVQIGEALLNRVVGASANAKTVGIGVCIGFRYWLYRELVQGLHGTVCHGGDAQRPHFPIFLRDIMPSERLRGITMPGKF